MNELELVAFQIISNVGLAKAAYLQAIDYAEKKQIDEVRKKIKEGDEAFNKGHEAHANLLKKEANGENVLSLLLIHAEDQLISTETIKILAMKFIKLYQEV